MTGMGPSSASWCLKLFAGYSTLDHFLTSLSEQTVVSESFRKVMLEKKNQNPKILMPFFSFQLQANETFAFIGNVTHYTRVWLNISAQLRTFLEEGRLHSHLLWLEQVYRSSVIVLCYCIAKMLRCMNAFTVLWNRNSHTGFSFYTSVC